MGRGMIVIEMYHCRCVQTVKTRKSREGRENGAGCVEGPQRSQQGSASSGGGCMRRDAGPGVRRAVHNDNAREREDGATAQLPLLDGNLRLCPTSARLPVLALLHRRRCGLPLALSYVSDQL